MHNTWLKETVWLLVLGAIIAVPGAFARAQGPSGNPLTDLPNIIKASPGCLGVETARTSSGKQVIFAWFENKKAVLNWYHSDAHQRLMKMGGGAVRAEGPLAGVPDDGRPVLAIASVTLTQPPDSAAQDRIPALSQIAIELYAPLPGGLAAGGRFAPDAVSVPGLLRAPVSPGVQRQ